MLVGGVIAAKAAIALLVIAFKALGITVGGILATLVDTAGGLALRPSLANPIEGDVATINLNVNYLRGASSDMTAHAEVVRAGRTVGVSQVLVESETPDGEVKPVAAGMGAYRLFQGDD